MRNSVSQSVIKYLLLLAFAVLLANCSSYRQLQPAEVNRDHSVKVFLTNGSMLEGIVLSRDSTTFTVMAASDHQTHMIEHRAVRRIERSGKHFDYQGNPISSAEIEKYKKNRNTWGYAVGGAAVGALGGLTLGYPVWLANDNPPPLFGAGVGLVVGSIYFATRGIKKDRDIAMSEVRYLHDREYELEQQKEGEEARLRDLARHRRRCKNS